MSKVWATILAILAGLAAALKISNHQRDKARDERDRERADRQVDKDLHEVETDVLTKQKAIADEEPEVVKRDDVPTGSFGDPRLRSRRDTSSTD